MHYNGIKTYKKEVINKINTVRKMVKLMRMETWLYH